MTARLLPDSDLYTPEGRRLLVALGAVDPDPLRVEAERWFRERPFGPMTYATSRVQQALGSDWSAELLEASARFKATPWKGKIA